MFQDAFVKLDRLEIETVLEEINPALSGVKFRAGNVIALGQDLPFYPGYRFLDLADHESMPPRRRFVVFKPGHVVVLNWTNEPIYALNDRVPIELDAERVTSYVRFFFTYVRGRHGRFIITENVDDINWKEEPPPAARKAIGKMLEPLRITETTDDGYTLLARMMFKDSLFRSNIHVRANGLVNLSGEELMIEDMPVLDDTFGQ